MTETEIEGAELEYSLALTSVTLFVHGKDLDPENVTRALNVKPDTTRLRGEKRKLSSGREITQKGGLWDYGITSETDEVEVVVERFCTIFEGSAVEVELIKGVDYAVLDILAIYNVNLSNAFSLELTLSSKSIDVISKLGVPIVLTTSVSVERPVSLD